MIKLRVSTPMAMVLETEDVESIVAEDETGAFGILHGHADFITVLPASVITWRDHNGAAHYVVVRSAVLCVRDGRFIDVAAREAVGEDTLSVAAEAVAEASLAEVEQHAESKVAATRLQLAAMKQLQRYLDAGRATLYREDA